MTLYNDANFVKLGKDKLVTSTLAESATLGTVCNSVDKTIYDAGDKHPCVLVMDVDRSLGVNGSATAPALCYFGDKGCGAQVLVKGTGTINAGDLLIANQSTLGSVSASTTADDVALYGMGNALSAKDSDGNVWMAMN